MKIFFLLLLIIISYILDLIHTYSIGYKVEGRRVQNKPHCVVCVDGSSWSIYYLLRGILLIVLYTICNNNNIDEKIKI